MNKNQVALIQLLLDDFTNLELVSLTNAITGFGRCHPDSDVYQKAVEKRILTPSGQSRFDREVMEVALLSEVSRRIETGKFPEG